MEDFRGILIDAHDLIQQIIKSHEEDDATEILLRPNIEIQPQLDYKGKMARRAYFGYRRDKNGEKPFCGILDIKIVSGGIDTEHEAHIIAPAIKHLDINNIRDIYEGQDPDTIDGLSSKQIEVACLLQAAFVEQELNWGPEDFQLWTRFGDSESKDEDLKISTSRDFLMVYLEKCSYHTSNGMGWGSIAAKYIMPYRKFSHEARSTILRPPVKNQKVAKDFRNYMPCVVRGKPSVSWISPHLKQIDKLCKKKGPNPVHVKFFPYLH